MNVSDARYLTFSLGLEHYAIPLGHVREVIAPLPTTALPHAPPHVRGIINLRGLVVRVLSLRVKFKLAEVKPHPKSAVVILDLGDQNLGVEVDVVTGVVTFKAEHVQAAPDVRTSMPARCLTGVVNQDGKLTAILDLSTAVA